MNLIPKKMSQLRRIALAVLLASFAILETPTISAQELGKTITSPFGIARQTSTSESGSDGDTFVDPETGEVGHIIRNPFGVANPEGVDTGIDIPDSGEEVGGIITSPFGVPASDDIDTGMDVFDEDEEYLISLPDDEESDVEGAENVDEVDDETSDDVKELEEESAGTTTEKYVPVIDNPIRGVEFDSIITLSGTSTYTVESETNDINNAPTLYVLAGGYFTMNLVTNLNLPTNIQPIFRKLNQSGTQNPFEPIQSGSNPPYCFVYHVPSAMYEGTYSASISCNFNGVQIERVLKIEIVYFEIKIDYSGNGTIDDDDVYDTNNPFGKLIHINNLDVDQDGIPDYADGFKSYGYENGSVQLVPISSSEQNGASLQFEKIIIRVSNNIKPSEWNFCFEFNQAFLNMINVNQQVINSDHYQTYEPRGSGTLRLWKKDGNIARSNDPITIQGDYIPSMINISLNYLDNVRKEKKDIYGHIMYYEYTIYVEAVKPCNNDAISGETITACLKKIQNAQQGPVEFNSHIVATPYQIVFEGIINDEITSSHVVYNPCGIIKWDNENREEAKFHFNTIPSNIPCATVNWSASTNLAFVGGNTGKSVTVRATGNVNSEFSLIIDIGRGNDWNPSIKGKILEENTVSLFVWVVAADENGNSPVITIGDIESFIDDVNQLYKQVGIKFQKVQTNYIKARQYIDVEGGFSILKDYRDISEDYVARSLVSYPQRTGFTREEDGLEIFFVRELYGGETLGLSCPGDGIIVASNTDFRTLAHELGHACGLNDIYSNIEIDEDNSVQLDNAVNVNSLWIKEDCTYTRIPNNSNMSVAGYYQYNLKHVELLQRLLMFGIDESGEECDISLGNVYGIDMDGSFCDVKTGLEGMERNPQHDR